MKLEDEIPAPIAAVAGRLPAADPRAPSLAGHARIQRPAGSGRPPHRTSSSLADRPARPQKAAGNTSARRRRAEPSANGRRRGWAVRAAAAAEYSRTADLKFKLQGRPLNRSVTRTGRCDGHGRQSSGRPAVAAGRVRLGLGARVTTPARRCRCNGQRGRGGVRA